MGIFYSIAPRTDADKSAQNAGEISRTGKPWAQGDQRFARHRTLTHTPPERNGERPPLLTAALGRLPKLLRSRSGLTHWTVTAIKPISEHHRGASLERVRLAVQIFHRHVDKLTPTGRLRQRRDQALWSAWLVLGYLLERCNVQRLNGPLSWLEVQRGNFKRIAEATGLSLSAVREAHILLQEAGFLRIERQRERCPTGWRELPARRWLTPHLFAALGLGKAYNRTLRGHSHRSNGPAPQPRQPSAPPTPPRQPQPASAPRHAPRTPAAAAALNSMRQVLGKPPDN